MGNQARNCRWLIPALRWLARVWAGLLFLFWGAFFVEHTAEWFVRGGDWPPLDVSLLHAAHFVMLVGFITGWRWELLGGVLALGGAMLFFPQAGGKNATLFTLVSIGPAILWIVLAGHSFVKCSAKATISPQKV